jgi:glycine cleavage system regulatory protein
METVIGIREASGAEAASPLGVDLIPKLAYPSRMQTRLVLTVIGPDRPGLVDRLSAAIASVAGSWQKSRMARLAGHFAGMVEVAIDADRAPALASALAALEGLSIEVTAASPEVPLPAPRVAHLTFVGQDRPGLVQAISSVLARAGANVEELDTHTFPSPMSGIPIFEAEAEVHVPHEVALEALRTELESVARDLMVDVRLIEET